MVYPLSAKLPRVFYAVLQKRKKDMICLMYYFNLHRFAAKLRTSMGMHNDQKYGKSIMTSHENSDRDNGAKMLII